jgi:hypothetical protein
MRGLPLVAQHLQQQRDGLRQRLQRSDPAVQVGAPVGGLAVLPGVVGRQVEPAGAAGHGRTAAHGHQPFVFGQRVAGWPSWLLSWVKACSSCASSASSDASEMAGLPR